MLFPPTPVCPSAGDTSRSLRADRTGQHRPFMHVSDPDPVPVANRSTNRSVTVFLNKDEQMDTGSGFISCPADGAICDLVLIPVLDPVRDPVPVLNPVRDQVPVLNPVLDPVPVLNPVLDPVPVLNPVPFLNPVRDPVRRGTFSLQRSSAEHSRLRRDETDAVTLPADHVVLIRLEQGDSNPFGPETLSDEEEDEDAGQSERYAVESSTPLSQTPLSFPRSAFRFWTGGFWTSSAVSGFWHSAPSRMLSALQPPADRRATSRSETVPPETCRTKHQNHHQIVRGTPDDDDSCCGQQGACCPGWPLGAVI
ncbi:hypothetical protein CCH79_00005503 [Gambusia affinis]|uniref:Uncharacterized protein n=1 Tax=Gambusia affinis TaxID=33528 RepID=A0A315VHH1_GAMAF|nr:hypothetical protein CCH79_00005503 [Gambusia affinis]